MRIIDKKDNYEECRIGIVTSRYNQHLTQLLYDGAVARLQELAIPEHNITAVWVPGAIEIPIVAQRLARSHNFEAIVCLGCVIRGETSHYDYVCDQVNIGCHRVSLKYDIPVIFGLLTTDNEAQAKSRLGGVHGHKGREAVNAALEMVAVLRAMDDH